MQKPKFLRAAENDLLEIWLYIAEDDQDAATRLLLTIQSKCQLLAENGKLGPERSDIAPGMRYFVVGNFLILYREVDETVEIVRVLHGARNLETIFNTKDD